MAKFTLSRRALAEFLGTWLLLAGIVGSGIMAERLSSGNVALALLANAIATGAVLLVVIALFAPISGAHLNPVVSLVFAIAGDLSAVDLGLYLAAQIAGAIAGTLTAHAMFSEPIFQVSGHERHGLGQLLSELVATFGLIATILACRKFRGDLMPAAVALYVVAGYWFTASTCFANPAVTLARSLTDTFTGIRPADVPWFIGVEIAGAILAAKVVGWLLTESSAPAARLVDDPEG